MKITLRQIEVFVSIAKLQNMTTASHALALSQSACSMALSNLEMQLRTPLFDRHGKKLLLNDQGKALLSKAEHILSLVTEFEASAASPNDDHLKGHLTIGASSTIGNYLLPPIIGQFILDYTNIKVSLSVSNTAQIIDDILNFNIDAGFIEGHCHHPDIDIIPWYMDELIIIAPTNHPFTLKQNINLDDLKQEPWIFRESGSGTRDVTDRFLQGKVKPFLILGDTEAIKQAVIAGFGIGCVSKITALDALSANKLIQLNINHANLERTLSVVIHREKYRTRALKHFLGALSPPISL